MNYVNNLLITTVVLALSGCANTNKELYSWGTYEPQVYSYFKGESPEKQIDVLEKHLAEVKADGETPPPGFYAHLGLLYSKVGRESEMKTMFDMEKNLFPESAVFIDNINNGFKVAK